MHDHLDLLILPAASVEAVSRVLALLEPPAASLVALLVPLDHASGMVIRLLDEQGRAADVDPTPYAALLSRGGLSVGLARIDGGGAHRSWEAWRDGVRELVLGPADELWIPLDALGQPDLDGDMRCFPEGPPAAGWRRLRTCLDLGMERVLSCRFTPVTRALDRLRTGDGEARALALASHGVPLRPPQEIPWRQVYRSL